MHLNAEFFRGESNGIVFEVVVGVHVNAEVARDSSQDTSEGAAKSLQRSPPFSEQFGENSRVAIDREGIRLNPTIDTSSHQAHCAQAPTAALLLRGWAGAHVLFVTLKH